jgi:hypothetical protein
VALTQWRIAGSYLEACNCDAICPCRMVDGVPGGRSTHGECYGALAWRVEEGDLSGSAAVMTFSYDDVEPGSPWTLVLYVDGPDELAEILLGRMGGKHVPALPWVRKPRDVVAVRRTRIDFGDGEVRAGDAVVLRATTPCPRTRRSRALFPATSVPDTSFTPTTSSWRTIRSHGSCRHLRLREHVRLFKLMFDHVTIRVSERAESRRFYEVMLDVLGFGAVRSSGEHYD